MHHMLSQRTSRNHNSEGSRLLSTSLRNRKSLCFQNCSCFYLMCNQARFAISLSLFVYYPQLKTLCQVTAQWEDDYSACSIFSKPSEFSYFIHQIPNPPFFFFLYFLRKIFFLLIFNFFYHLLWVSSASYF